MPRKRPLSLLGNNKTGKGFSCEVGGSGGGGREKHLCNTYSERQLTDNSPLNYSWSRQELPQLEGCLDFHSKEGEGDGQKDYANDVWESRTLSK